MIPVNYNNVLNPDDDTKFFMFSRMGERFKFFYGRISVFSQHHPASFHIDGVTYNCAEQYYMHSKALMFGDEVRARRIMEVADPVLMKSLGRKVVGFNKRQWLAVARDVVRKGNLAKFSQNPHLLRALLETTGTVLVEASPYDRVWGIGLCETDSRARNRSTWLGTNWLGETLTLVRDNLMDLYHFMQHH